MTELLRGFYVTVVDDSGRERRAAVGAQLVVPEIGGPLDDVPLPDELRRELPPGLAIVRVEYRTLAARDRIEVTTVIRASPADRRSTRSAQPRPAHDGGQPLVDLAPRVVDPEDQPEAVR